MSKQVQRRYHVAIYPIDSHLFPFWPLILPLLASPFCGPLCDALPLFDWRSKGAASLSISTVNILSNALAHSTLPNEPSIFSDTLCATCSVNADLAATYLQ